MHTNTCILHIVLDLKGKISFFNGKQFCDLLIEVKGSRNNNNEKTFICSNEKGPVQNRMQTVAAA